TVPAHTGQDRADRHRTDDIGHRLEQYIDARPMAGVEFVLGQSALELAGTLLHPQMPVAAGHVGLARLDRHTVLGFDYPDLAELIEARCKARGEARRHMLRDDDRRTIRRHLTEDDADRLDAARRRPDRNQRPARTGSGPQTGRWRRRNSGGVLGCLTP